MTTIKYLFIFLLIFPFKIQAQTEQSKPSLREAIFDSVLQLVKDTVVNGQNSSISGTGSFIDDSGKFYIVTAEHVSIHMDTACRFIIRNNLGKPEILILKNYTKQNKVKWIQHKKADLAVIEIYPNNKDEQNGLNSRSIPVNMIVDSLISPSVDNQLTIFGFPNGLGIQNSEGYFSPFTFRTYASSMLVTLPISIDDKNIKSFCEMIGLENPSVQGYSGGPVFDLGQLHFSGVASISSGPPKLIGFVHGTMNDNTGGKIGLITPSKFLFDLIK